MSTIREATVMRVWRTGLDGTRAREYDAFATEVSLPMFRRHEGFRGVVFAGAGGERVVVTFWATEDDARALAASPDYQETVRRIEAEGFLRPPQTTETLPVASISA